MFAGDISKWVVTSLTDMGSMFWGALAFDGDLSNWDTSNVINMRAAFSYAAKFNGDISSWITSNANNMAYMFRGTLDFNVDLSRWDSSAVTTMTHSKLEKQSFLLHCLRFKYFESLRLFFYFFFPSPFFVVDDFQYLKTVDLNVRYVAVNGRL